MRHLSFLLVFLFISGAAQAVDLDVDGAKRKYEAAQRDADRAKRDLDDAERDFNYARDEVDRAQSRAKDAEANFKRETQKLIGIGEEIDRIADEIPRLESKKKSLEQQKSRAERDLKTLEGKRPGLQAKLRNLRSQLRDVNSKISAEEAKPEPDKDLLKRLRQQKRNLQSQIQTTQNELNNLNSQISSKENEIRTLERDIDRKEDAIRRAKNDIQNLQRDFQYQNGVVERAGLEMKRRNGELEDALKRFNVAKGIVEAADETFKKKDRLAKQAYAYYQQVVANYNKERDKIIQMASAAGRKDGSAEASERAVITGAEAGKASAASEGEAAGTQDGKARDKAKGYAKGRKDGATSGALAEFFQKGVKAGAAIAQTKAFKEDYPKGYNEALVALLSGVPNGTETHDITESLNSVTSAGGKLVSDKPLAVGKHPAPHYEFLKEPGYDLPRPGTPGVSVPDTDNRYYSPPCGNLVLPEFGPLCRNKYGENYLGGFDSNYRAVFISTFKENFSDNIKAAYDAALAKTHGDSTQSGLVLGAEHAGILKGFADELPKARQQQYAAGKKQLGTLLSQGYLPLLRSIKLVETNEDGLFTPGESIKVVAVFDNYGKLATPEAKFRIKITEVDGVEELSHEERSLPGLSADTRTELTGVLTAKVGSKFAGQKINLKGRIEAEVNGGYVTVSEFDLDEISHFPVELESIELSEKPKVNEWTEATFVYKNLTDTPTKEAPLSVWASPAEVEVKAAGEEEEATVPALAPGESAEVTLQLKPGVWVGGNTAVHFFSELKEVLGLESIVQPFDKVIEVDRAASLELYDNWGRPVPSGTLDVQAGSRLGIQIQFKFHADKRLPGPFVVRSTRKSVPQITHSNNSTTSVNYGSWGPGWTAQKIRFSYDIPRSLAGQKHWVMIQLDEGGRAIHALQVHLNVK